VLRRKSRTRAEPAEEPRTDAESSTAETSAAETSARDHDEFWSGAPLGVDEHLDPLAGVIEDDEQEMADDTLEYMGSAPRTRIDPDELVKLAKWAETKACRVCQKKMHETHDPATLQHANCRSALRVERLLRRYT
jgi:hypothetical protein